MRASRFSEEQIIHLLPQAERGEQSIGALCREHGITEPTCYRWRQQFGGMTVPDAQRLRELSKENARLKRLLAERDLEVDARKALLAKKSCRWRHAVRRSNSWSPVGFRRVGPVFCGNCRARRSATQLAPMATGNWPCQSTSWPDGIHALDTAGCGRCSDVAASVCTRSPGSGAGSGRKCRSARLCARGSQHAP
jgi:putative transposase